jgi:hypothetical protein
VRSLGVVLLGLSFFLISFAGSSAEVASCMIEKSDSKKLTVAVEGPGSAGPIPAAWVRVQHWGAAADTREPRPIVDADGLTDAKGLVKVELPSQGFYDVFASAAGFFPGIAICEIHDGYAGRVTFHLPVGTGSGLEWSTQKHQ